MLNDIDLNIYNKTFFLGYKKLDLSIYLKYIYMEFKKNINVRMGNIQKVSGALIYVLCLKKTLWVFRKMLLA